MRVLNLYSGVGGNRKLWSDCEVVAVELDSKIASIYRKLYPHDTVIEEDAHDYLRRSFAEFDFIWSSPPCQTHSRMAKATRHRLFRYTDLSLYEEIMFLKQYCNVPWVVENVKPHYSPLINPTFRVGRHLFWHGNFYAGFIQDFPTPHNFINRCNLAGKTALMDWLDIHYEENIYYKNNHCPAQILRNCVHPKVGLQIFTAAKTGSILS